MELSYTNSLDKDSTDYLLVRYVINKMNVYNSDNSKFVDKSCSIEHILPDDFKDERSWNIGNLIPLEEGINNKLDNIEYDLKKTGYLKSNYTEVKAFVDENATWEVDQIEDRAEELAEIFYKNILHEEIRKI